MGRRAVFATARRHYAYALVSAEEYALVRRLADKDGLSVSDFVRRCINCAILETTDDSDELLQERRSKDRVEA